MWEPVRAMSAESPEPASAEEQKVSGAPLRESGWGGGREERRPRLRGGGVEENFREWGGGGLARPTPR